MTLPAGCLSDSRLPKTALPAIMAEINVLVLDNGSETIKAGYCIPERDPLLVRRAARRAARLAAPQCSAARDLPPVAPPARFGAPAARSERCLTSVSAQVTPSAVRLASGDAVPSDGGDVLRPIRRGVVQDWEALESIYHHIFYEQARRCRLRPAAARADACRARSSAG